MVMQMGYVRTTVDIEEELARKLKEYSARHGLKQKSVISQALMNYIKSEARENDVEKLWKSLRKLTKNGKTNINLISELRKDRSR